MADYDNDAGAARREALAAPKPTSTTQKSTAKPAASKPKAPTWYFNGKVYYSEAAYLAAVNAHQRAIAEQRAAAQRAELARRRAAFEQRGSEVARQQSALRARQEELAAARRQAFSNLQTRYQNLLDERQRAEAKRRQQRTGAEQYEAADRRVVGTGDRETDARVRRMGETITEGDRRRSDLLVRAREAGDYESIFRYIADQQKKTGGRYVDRVLYEAANTEANKLLAEVRTERERMVEKIYRAFDAERWDEVIALVDSPEYQELEQRFARYFGTGRDESPAQRWAAIQQEIATAQNQWMTDQLMPQVGLDRAWAEFERENLRRELKPGRTQRLEGNYEEISLADWLKDQDRQARAAQAAEVEELQRMRRNILNHGYYGEEVEMQNGQMVFSDSVRQGRQFEAMRELFTGGKGWGGVISEADFRRLMNDVNNGLPVDRERATRELMRLGLEAYEQRDGHIVEAISGGGVDYLQSKRGAARQQATEMQRRTLERFLTGDVQDGVAGLLNRYSFNPLIGGTLGNVVTGWERVVGGTTSLARLATAAATGGGQIALPDVELDAIFGSGNPFLSRTSADGGDVVGLFDRSGGAKERTAQELRELMAVIGDPNTPLDRRLDAIATFGRGWASGNTSILAEGLLDPFNFLPMGRFLRGGRLAAAELGGVRALVTNPRAGLREFARLSLPERFGGLTSNEVEILAERLRLSQKQGIDFQTVKAMTDEELAALADETLRKPFEEAIQSGPWQRLVENNPTQAQQLFAAISDEAAQLATGSNVRRITSEALQRDIDYAREAATKGAIQERSLVARQERLTAETKGAAALETVRAEQARAGVAPAVARDTSPLTAPQKGARTRLVREFEQRVAERVKVAREASAAMADLEAARDGLFRHAHFERLERATARLRQLDDDLVTDPVTGVQTVNQGEVSVARRNLDDFDRANGSSDSPPGFLNVTSLRVNRDVKYVQAQLVYARARLRAATAPGQIRYWSLRIKQLGEAKDYLDVERRLLRPARATARRSMRKHAPAAARAINLNRVAARAVTPAAGREWVLRDVRRRFVGATVEPAPLRASTQDVADFATARAGLANSRLDPDVAKSFADLRTQFGDVDLLDFAYAVWSGQHQLKGAMWDTWLAMRNAIEDELARTRPKGKRPTTAEIDRLMERYGAEQLAPGRLTMRQYRILDNEVSAAIRDARQWAARGQIRLGKVTKATSSNPVLRRDGELAEVYAKLAALKARGVALEAYDQSRSVLSDINLRFNRGVTLRRRSASIARRSGKPQEEVFDTLREGARLDEVAQNLERLAMSNPGMSEDEIFALFELQMIERDLAPFSKRPLTAYQAEVLSGAYGDLTSGADINDLASAHQILGTGASEAPPFGDRGAMHEWMIEHGAFSPRTADAIRSGERVYSIEAERDFWESGYGYTPPWTTTDDLLPILRNKDAYDAQMREWGVFNNDFERLMTSASLSGERLRDAMVFGGDGIQRARSWEELRSWAIQRYGGLVSDDGSTLKEMPWLMNLTEYDDWIGRAVFDEPLMKAAGIEFDPSMVKPRELTRFADAVSAATRKAFERSADLKPVLRGSLPPLDDGGRWMRPDETSAASVFPVQEIPADAPRLKAGAAAYGVKHAANGIFDGGVLYVRRGASQKTIWHEAGHALEASNPKALADAKAAIVGTSDLRAEMGAWLGLGHGVHMNFEEIVADLFARAHLAGGWDELLDSAPTLEIRGRVAAAAAHIDTYTTPTGLGVWEGARWLPQEQVRFVMDVVDHLKADPTWRRFFDKASPGKRILDNVGAFWRAAMTWTIAFPLVNFLDSVGIKRGILAATQNGFRPLSRVSAAAREVFPDVDSLPSRAATWYVSGRNGLANAFDSQFDSWMRVREAGRAFTELPVRLSKFGEDRLRLDFTRSMFDQHYSALIETGVADDLARRRARAFAIARADQLFPDLSNASAFVRVLNQIVPFFSYNLKLKIIGARLALENPWLLTMGERLGDFIEEQNRIMWENEHGPDVPFPEGDPSARRLWIRVGDTTYTFDLGSMSDLTRGMTVITEAGDRTAMEWATEFFRVPHPSQAIFLAVAFGFNDGLTPWGTEAKWEDVSIWFDMASWLMDGGSEAFDPNDPRSRDAIQMVSQMLFFKGVGRLSPMKVKVQQFFGFMALDRDRAWQYYEDNPDLAAYFQLNGSRYRVEPGVKVVRHSWFASASDAERAEYNAAFDGYEALRDSLEEKLDQYYLEPWSAEYRMWKKRRRALLTGYLKDHPILGDVWGFWMEPSEFAELRDEWRVDELVDAYFALDDVKPARDAFGTDTAGELEYQRALSAWYDMRTAWLEANPQVYDRLHHARNEVERAWFEQELQWAETLDRTSDVKIRQLELELVLEGNPDDEDARLLLNTLHDLQESNYRTLDAEAFGDFYRSIETDRPSALARLRNQIATRVTFPGRADQRYADATPAERRSIERDERYSRELGELWAKIGDDVTRFYPEMSAWLRAEYFRRNPEKEAAYLTGNEYRGWMGRWVAALERNDFNAAQAVWDSMPAWVHERYFSRHPDSKMRDGMGGGGGSAVQYGGQWFKSEESRQRFVQGQAYFGAMQTWVDLLRAKRYAEAEAHFRNLPSWMQEKYYAKHPDQRAKNEIDNASLTLAASYFLAETDADKLKVLERNRSLRDWLTEHGGNEAAMRGLILAIYRAIPTGEAWLKRTFRERYPEFFSQDAAGERRLKKVARELAEHPEMRPFYDRAFALQSQLFREQLKLQRKPPRQLEMERRRRLRKRTKRRAARFSSEWAMHYEARRGIRNSAGS
jgi:hypothetical protein